MNRKDAFLGLFASVLVLFTLASGKVQQAPAPAVKANPTPRCTATPAEVEANQK